MDTLSINRTQVSVVPKHHPIDTGSFTPIPPHFLRLTILKKLHYEFKSFKDLQEKNKHGHVNNNHLMI